MSKIKTTTIDVPGNEPEYKFECPTIRAEGNGFVADEHTLRKLLLSIYEALKQEPPVVEDK